MRASLPLRVREAEGELVEIEYIFSARGPLRHEDDLAAEAAHALLRRLKRAEARILRRAVAAEAVDPGHEEPFDQPGGEPLVELPVLPVEKPAGIRSEILSEPLRLLLQQSAASLMLRGTPVYDVEEDPDIPFMRLVHEVAEHLPLFHGILLSGQQRAQGVDSEVSVAVPAVDRRREPDAVDPHLRQMVEGREQPLYGSVGRSGVDAQFDDDEAFDPIRRLAALRILLHDDFGIRFVRRHQRGVVDCGARKQGAGEKRGEKRCGSFPIHASILS